MTTPAHVSRPDWMTDVIGAIRHAADPARALRASWRPPAGPVWVLAIGKASVPMCREAMALVKSPPVRVLCTSGTPGQGEPFRVLLCDHPYPTERNVAAAKEVAAFVEAIPSAHTLVLLISGGGSAHLCLPAEGMVLDDIRAVTLALQLAGASIVELNTVRKHIEQLKGGRTASRCAARIDAYVLSDVVDDPLDVIASGPAAPDPTTFTDALGVMDRFGLTNSHPAVVSHLRRGAAGGLPETPKPCDAAFGRVRHVIIANNRTVVDAAAGHLRRAGMSVAGVRYAVVGESATIARAFARTLASLPGNGPACIVWGGETSVTVGNALGAGGPSQEFALAAALALETNSSYEVLAYSTDGRDGPTDAAGAWIDGATLRRARDAGIDPASALDRHDSHGALRVAGALVPGHAAGTNLNHVWIGVRRDAENHPPEALADRSARQQ